MSEPEEETEGPLEGDLERIVEKISTEHGFDVRGYKRTTLYRRIRKRMQDARCATPEDYQVRLETDAGEYAQLINTILINVTEFFRDPQAWEYVQKECLAPLVRRKPADEPIRAWSAGCATGEEPYSLAICLAELTEGTGRPFKIYATDMDEGALSIARAGVYHPTDLRHVSPERRERFFEELPGGRYRTRREIRSNVIYGQHNLLEHAPISRLDVLVCRNVLIYFDTATQQQLLRRINYSLREDGFLFLGKAETLLSRSALFRIVEPRYRVFQKVPAQDARTRGPIVPQRPPNHNSGPQGEDPVMDNAIPVEQALEPVILLDASGNIHGASPTAREIFGISDRVVGGSLAQLDEKVRPAPLRLAIEDARATLRETRVEELQLQQADGAMVTLNVTVKPLLDPDGGLLQLVVWSRDVTREQDLLFEVARVRQELETTSEELQTTNEELETTNEELQSTNEELETTNEELQSTNEELETTIEELQSTNEELETANDELRARQEELNERDRFQTIVLSSLQMGLIVVWNTLEVASWNRACEELWGVREEEVVGHGLFTLDSGMPFDLLRKPLLSVIQGEETSQSLEVDAVNRRGRQIRCRIRILPLISAVNGPAGAMILVDSVNDRT